jgi:flagellar motor component MotA
MSVDESREAARRESAGDTVAGFLAAFAVAAAALGIVWYPGRLGPAAMLVSLIAAALAGAQRRFVGAAVAFVTVAWLAGMVVAVVTDRPIF